MKASSYCGLVVVDVAIVQCDGATIDPHSTSILPEGGKHGTLVKSEHPIGMGWFHKGERVLWPGWSRFRSW